MRSPISFVVMALGLLSCGRAPEGGSRSPSPDAALPGSPPDTLPASDATAPNDRAPACDVGPTSAETPYVFDRDREFKFGELYNLAIAATGNGRVGIVIGRPELEYLDSLDGGATFRPAVSVRGPGATNLRFAMGQGFAFLTYADFAGDKQLLLQRAALATGGVAGFDAPVTVANPDGYVGDVVFGPGQQMAVNSGHSGAVDGFFVSFSTNSGGSFASKVEVDPYPLQGPGLFGPDGRFYAFYYYNNSTTNWVIHARVTDPTRTRFGAPVSKQIEGLIDEPKGTFTFPTKSGEIAFMKAHRIAFTDRAPVVVDRFVPSTGAWGRSNIAFDVGQLRCLSVAALDGGRLVVVLQTEAVQSETLLLQSADGGETFPLRQKLPASLGSHEYCPLTATDGRALYLLWPRADKSLHFFRATQPGTCS